MTTYVCPMCNREFCERGIKVHIQSALSKHPICLVCGKEFRTTQQLCVHSHICVWNGDTLHAAVYYLARRYSVGRRWGRKNTVATLGEQIAMELLKKGGVGHILLNPHLPNKGEWYSQLTALTHKCLREEITIPEAARMLGLQPPELKTIWSVREEVIK